MAEGGADHFLNLPLNSLICSVQLRVADDLSFPSTSVSKANAFTLSCFLHLCFDINIDFSMICQSKLHSMLTSLM